MFSVLHIADFALHAVLRTTSDPAPGAAAALFSGTGKKSLVLAANRAARGCGVELGMTAPQAVARCPSLVIRTPQPAAEAEARAALLAVAFMFSPSIEDTAPGVCTIDLRGLPPEKFDPAAHAAVAELAQLGLPATAGIGATPLLALYAARNCSAARAHDRALARSVERSSRPQNANSLTSTSESKSTCATEILHVTDPASFLRPLPLSAADPSPALASIFHGWGLRTLGDLTALPRDEIVRRFGTEGLALWSRAAGGAPRPLHPVAPAREFAAQLELEEPIETLEPLLFLLRRLLDRLTVELRGSQFVAAEFELRLQLEDETWHARSFRLPEPTADVEILFRTLHTHLESLHTAASIAAIQLRLVPTRPLVRQQGLFETGLRDPHGFAETLARVSALVGPDRVGTPQLEDTHRPDAVKLISPHPVIPPAATPPLHAPLSPPLRRFRPPLAAHVEFTAGQATYLWSEPIRGEISFQSPPWYSSGDWWQADRTWNRIEWDIALMEGGLYRLLQRGDSYFIEGEYD